MLLKTVTTHVHRLTVKIVHEICVKSNGQILQKSGKLLHTSFARIGTKEENDKVITVTRPSDPSDSVLRDSGVLLRWCDSLLRLNCIHWGRGCVRIPRLNRMAKAVVACVVANHMLPLNVAVLFLVILRA